MINSNVDIYPIWKPKDMTSSDVVRHIKKKYDLDRVGHCGTLDPFAEGVLILLSNDRTIEADSFMNESKIYETTIALGSQTDTLDPTGTILKVDSIEFESVSKLQIEDILNNFKGEIDQRPPCFSAKRINGVRLYKLARQDVFVHLKPVKVYIQEIKLISLSDRELTIGVKCGKGVYIRQLGADIAKALGTVGYLKSLTRKSIGQFNEENSINFNEFLN